MVNTADVQRYADVIMAMIKQDQDSGQVPREVSSWDELDDSVDTDDYYRQALLPTGTPAATDLHNAVNDEVTRRLSGAQGGPWMVTWTPPGRPWTSAGRSGTRPRPKPRRSAGSILPGTAAHITFTLADRPGGHYAWQILGQHVRWVPSRLAATAASPRGRASVTMKTSGQGDARDDGAARRPAQPGRGVAVGEPACPVRYPLHRQQRSRRLRGLARRAPFRGARIHPGGRVATGGSSTRASTSPPRSALPSST